MNTIYFLISATNHSVVPRRYFWLISQRSRVNFVILIQASGVFWGQPLFTGKLIQVRKLLSATSGDCQPSALACSVPNCVAACKSGLNWNCWELGWISPSVGPRKLFDSWFKKGKKIKGISPLNSEIAWADCAITFSLELLLFSWKK